ncbi:4682_t:CDS:2 [Rhizophagus irregularis]|nr:4682_t:CDS:2 [Rhizophagus irregularis]
MNTIHNSNVSTRNPGCDLMIIHEIDKSLNVCETTAEIFYQILFHQNATNTDCYEGFKTVYNTEISEKYHPILMAAMENAERAPPAILTNTKVHDIIQCFQCGKF